ncbi:fimbrial protein [Franconibacter helveticus]|uniref:fimbrial protein n=1 Tax=Franconibacter helveticus TaxID=357240 RepID=UPI0019550209|nr:fimbrial protein [Franconibacter helveticus]
MRIRLIVSLLSGAVMVCFSCARAATGYCNTEGGPKIYNVDATSKLDDGSLNAAGKTFNVNFGSSDSYAAKCDCDVNDKQQKVGAYYKAVYLVPSVQTGDMSFIHINDNMDMAAFIHIANYDSNFAVPFVDIWNKKNNGCDLTSFSTGREGSLTFRINKPFLGQIVIPSMPVAAIYGTVRPGQYSTEPMAEVYVQGIITVPQNCEINAGSVISIDFGTILTSQFQTKHEKPSNYTEKRTSIAYICNNIDEAVQLRMTFSGPAADDMPEALQTSNPDVGVVIKDGAGTVIPLNTGELPMTLQQSGSYINQQGAADILTAPVNLTGNVPATGQFNASASITINIK